jgi:hypothetical protein
MDPDQAHLIENYSAETVAALCDWLEQSGSREQLVYREAELDDLWRLLDTALADARRDSRRHALASELERLLAVTVQAHDLVGCDEEPLRAAALLREAIASELQSE